MADKNPNGYPNKDELLNRLIRESETKFSKEFERPSDDAIRAYLLGTATVQQKAEILSALDVSPDFRNELLEMAEELEEFASSETSQKAAQLKINEVPVKVLRKVEPKNKNYSIRIVGSLAAAALLLIVAISVFDRTNMSTEISTVPDTTLTQIAFLQLVSQEVDPGLLVRTTVRGQTTTHTYTRPDEAALAEFRYLLKYEDGEFKFDSEVPQPLADSNTRVIQLKIQDDTGKIIKEFTAVIPKSDSATAPVEAWILNLHERSLYKVDMTADTVSVQIDEKQISKGCVTFTYGGDDWFSSTLGFTYNFQEAR